MSVTKALLIIDVQNDFCPGGALAAPQGDKVIPVLNQYIEAFTKEQWPVLASRDWHPPKTSHFKDYGGQWPVHCVQNTKGAEFHSDLKLPKETIILSKGMEEKKDGYSAFEGMDDQGRSLPEILKRLGIKELFIGGLATDYCVKASCLDALKNGFKVNLLVDAIKGVNVKAGDAIKAVEAMFKNGARKVTIKELK